MVTFFVSLLITWFSPLAAIAATLVIIEYQRWEKERWSEKRGIWSVAHRNFNRSVDTNSVWRCSLIVEHRLFGYEDTELVQKIIMALVNLGLTLIATSYGLMG